MFLILFVLLLLNVSSFAFCPPPNPDPHDTAVWQELYDATDGPNWHQCSDAREHPCLCDPVEITKVTYKISSLLLHANNLRGTLPESLFSLSEVVVLELPSNQLEGTLPGEIVSSSLQSTILTDNLLSGGLPLLNQTRLTRVDFSGNKFSGSPNLRDIPSSLSNFQASRNLLSGPIGEIADACVILDLSQNWLTGPFPAVHGLLFFLDVSQNRLTGTIPPVRPETMYLLLSQNAFSGPFPDVSNAVSLEVLYVANNNLKGSVPWLQHLTSLTKLALFGNHGLRGRLPCLPTSLFQPNASIFLQDCSFSCTLEPAGCSAWNSTTSHVGETCPRLVAIGNRFSMPIPDAVCAHEQSSVLWVRSTAAQSQDNVTFGVVGTCVLLVGLGYLGVFLNLPIPHGWQRLAVQAPDTVQPTCKFLMHCRRFLLALCIPSVALLMLYLKAQNIYQCSEWLAKTTVGYIEPNTAFDSTAIHAVLVIHFAFCTCGLLLLAMPLTAPPTPQQPEAEQQVLRCVSGFRLAAVTLVVIAGSTLAVVSVVAQSIPVADSHHLPNFGDKAQYVKLLAGPVLGVIANQGVPVVARAVSWHTQQPPTLFMLNLTLFLQVLLVIVIPVVVVLLVDNACGQGWKWFWGPCSPGSKAFDSTITTNNPWGNPISKPDDMTRHICAINPHFDHRCSGRVVEFMSYILVTKLLMQCVLAGWLPLVRSIMFGNGFLFGHTKLCNFRLSSILAVAVAVAFGGVAPMVTPVAALTALLNELVLRILVAGGREPDSDWICSPTQYVISLFVWIGIIPVVMQVLLSGWVLDQAFLGVHAALAVACLLMLMIFPIWKLHQRH